MWISFFLFLSLIKDKHSRYCTISTTVMGSIPIHGNELFLFPRSDNKTKRGLDFRNIVEISGWSVLTIYPIGINNIPYRFPSFTLYAGYSVNLLKQ